MERGIDLIKKERAEQIEKHGYTPENDKRYKNGELEMAAYATLKSDIGYWPENWGKNVFYNIKSKYAAERLAVAGAFYMAENERIGEDKFSSKIEEIASQIDSINGFCN